MVTVPPEITHQEIANNVDQTATNEINQINVESGPPAIAETIPSPPNTYESTISENEIENGPNQTPPSPPTEYNTDDPIEIATEMPPATISQRKNRRRGKKMQDIDEEFASRLDVSCADAKVVAPPIENAFVASYIQYVLSSYFLRSHDKKKKLF